MMFKSGAITTLLLAVLFVSVQGRSIQNEGEFNCFSHGPENESGLKMALLVYMHSCCTDEADLIWLI